MKSLSLASHIGSENIYTRPWMLLITRTGNSNKLSIPALFQKASVTSSNTIYLLRFGSGKWKPGFKTGPTTRSDTCSCQPTMNVIWFEVQITLHNHVGGHPGEQHLCVSYSRNRGCSLWKERLSQSWKQWILYQIGIAGPFQNGQTSQKLLFIWCSLKVRFLWGRWKKKPGRRELWQQDLGKNKNRPGK